MKTAKFWHADANGMIYCDLCPQGCRLTEGKAGLCRVRGVRDGELKAMGYGLISSVGVDPIEKKPLYHFRPGSMIFSFGGWGCNLSCEFCQNWTISQAFEIRSKQYTAEQIVAQALESESIGIAYTYNEPMIGLEFVEECARLARSKGLLNVLVTNGFIKPEPAEELLPLIDALNIDIKSMDDSFYRKMCHGALAPVLAFSVQAVKAGCHVEITNLLIPSLNDDDRAIKDLAVWVRKNLGETTALHLSAYHPQYKVNIPATALELVEHAHELCSAELPYVYMGNVWTDKGSNTICPKCGNIMILRQGYEISVTGLKESSCSKCGRKTDVIIR